MTLLDYICSISLSKKPLTEMAQLFFIAQNMPNGYNLLLNVNVSFHSSVGLNVCKSLQRKCEVSLLKYREHALFKSSSINNGANLPLILLLMP